MQFYSLKAPERLMTLIIIPIFVGVVINKISNKKEKDHRNSIGRSDDGGFNFELSFKIKMRKK